MQVPFHPHRRFSAGVKAGNRRARRLQVQFVSFQPVSSPEHLAGACAFALAIRRSCHFGVACAAFGVFGLLQLYNLFFYLKSLVPPEHLRVLIRSVGHRVRWLARCCQAWRAPLR